MYILNVQGETLKLPIASLSWEETSLIYPFISLLSETLCA